MTTSEPLRVLVDGTPLSDSEARGFWQRFSEWMEKHAGDLGGFARAEGLASVHPEVHAGAPVLAASRSAPQRAYASATTKPAAQGGAKRAKRAKGPRGR